VEQNGSDEIPEEQATEQQLVPFMGDDLAAAMAAGGSIYISLPGMCGALGLSTQAQLRRIERTRTLAKGLRRISLQTKGGFQRVNCLRLDLIALWLAGAQTASMKSEFRAKIDTYQEELAPVATQVFMRVVGLRTAQLVPSDDPRIAALAEQIDTLTEIATFLREHMQGMLEAQGHVSMRLEQAVQLLEALAGRQQTTESQVARIDERTQRLTPAHAREVQLLVERIARVIERQAATATLSSAHAMIYGRLKTRFRAGSYKEIPDERFEEVMTYLREELRKVAGSEGPTQGGLFGP
jgi:P22_AR N-terminal domain/ORF6C domain